jgi:N12 class adenine-specific DNA methylase/SAM-dependent methyltransferase
VGAADAGLLGHLGGRGSLAADFRPAQQGDLAPAGLRAKANANLAALEVLAALRAEGRPADPAEQAVLARWSGWGALPGVFDERDTTWTALRGELRRHLDGRAWDAARRTVLNAHYSPAEVAEAIWTAVTELGFTGGRVLEPGCGSGNFIGLTPQGVPVEMVGVELDPTTAAIAQALYTTATIRAEGFETTRFPDGFFDLTVGNVPFAKVAMHDPEHNPGRLTLHNHFIVKSLALTRPGGLVAVVTSRFTLDARNPAARRTMSELADLVGALRLPAGALRAAAGTDAISDVLILRRREPGREPSGEAWEHVVPVATPDGDVTVNEYFARHPDRILGQLRASGGQYSATDLDVIPGPEPLADRLAEARRRVVAEACGAGLGWAARTGAAPSATAGADVGRSHKEGAILLARSVAAGFEPTEPKEGRFFRVVNGVAEPFEPKPAKDRAELAALLGLRDAFIELLELEATTRDDEVCSAARRTLNQRYDAYAARWGPLNRFSLVRTGRVDPDTGETLFRQARPAMGGFRDDPDARSVMAVEVFDPETQTATKAAVFHRRVVTPREPRRGADTAQDALAICLDERGRVDLDVISGLLGVDATTARAELAELVWDDPQTGRVVPAAEYLSGDVRAKLAAADVATATDPRRRANVEALTRIMPADLGPAEINARLGAPWIPTGDVARFIAEVLGPTAVVEYVPVTATWGVQVPSWQRNTVAVTSTWGTSRADAISLVVASLNQRPATVYDALDDGRRILNPAETLAAREKQEALEERFAAWVREDPTRAQRLADEYNRLFNSTVLPAYDGAHLSLSGLAADFRPHAHQRVAVWRILSQPTVLLAHDVGAGKTATMAMAAMELHRLGLVHKPAFVVPNHMLDQFSRELAQLYPRAKILVAERDDTSAAARREFVARCATGDWEAVVITASTFGRIPVSHQTRIGFMEKRIAELRQAAAESKEGLTVKRLEAHIARMEQRHERLLAASEKDDGVRFEQTGIDYLFVDEAHHFKNRPFATNIAGVGGQGSQRAEDLEMKLDYLRSRHGPRVATFATATPVANSLAEMWVMQAYLQPHRLAATGVTSFDAWAATFGRTVTALELAPDGGSYRLSTRFARFRNVPELLTMFRETADVRSATQLALKIPAVTGGHPSTVVVPASDQLTAYVAELVERAERVRSRLVRPDEDNMLKISGDGRRAALDLRLVGHPLDPAGGKITAAANHIAAIHAAHKATRYADPSGEAAARPGALQTVFCDLGTPQPDGRWSVYEELRSQLALRSVPPSMVRFVHEAADDRAKAE